MKIDRETIEITFALVKMYPKDFATSFYQNLFQSHPDLKKDYLNCDRETLEKELITFLESIVDNLHDLDEFKLLLRRMEEKQIKYYFILVNYKVVGKIFLETLKCYLKDNWKPEVEQAWTDAYKRVFHLMKKEAKDQDYFQNYFSNNLTSNMKRMRVEAIARKALRDGGSMVLVARKLLKDSCFQEAKHKFGRKKTIELVLNLIFKARQEEQLAAS